MLADPVDLDDTPIHPDWDAELFKNAHWVVSAPDRGRHVFYFMPNGSVYMVTDRDGKRSKRVFSYYNGQWMKEKIHG
jgi:hypothetical protein